MNFSENRINVYLKNLLDKRRLLCTMIQKSYRRDVLAAIEFISSGPEGSDQNKFAVFFLNSTGLEVRTNSFVSSHVSGTGVVKVFIMCQNNSDVSRTWNSFYVRVTDKDEDPRITIKHPFNPRWYFSANGYFMSKKEAIPLLKDKNNLKYFLSQQVWPKSLLEQCITIVRPRLKLPEGRKLTIRKKFRDQVKKGEKGK